MVYSDIDNNGRVPGISVRDPRPDDVFMYTVTTDEKAQSHLTPPINPSPSKPHAHPTFPPIPSVQKKLPTLTHLSCLPSQLPLRLPYSPNDVKTAESNPTAIPLPASTFKKQFSPIPFSVQLTAEQVPGPGNASQAATHSAKVLTPNLTAGGHRFRRLQKALRPRTDRDKGDADAGAACCRVGGGRLDAGAGGGGGDGAEGVGGVVS